MARTPGLPEATPVGALTAHSRHPRLGTSRLASEQFVTVIRACASPCRARPVCARHVRHDERDTAPVRGRPAGMGCPVGQDHVALALASLTIGLGACRGFDAAQRR